MFQLKMLPRKLEDTIIQKDPDGKYCYQFVRDVPNADIGKLQNAIIQKDPNGKYLTIFVFLYSINIFWYFITMVVWINISNIYCIHDNNCKP